MDPVPHLLIVDDELSIRLSLQTFLEDMGYSVSVAERGAQALAMIEATAFDTIVLDLSMPDMSGLDVLRSLGDRARTMPVIVCSGTGAFKDAVAALRLGAWDFLSKPIPDLTLLAHALQRSLERAAFIRAKDRMLEVLDAKVQERTAELQAANVSLEQKNLALREILFISRNETERVRSEFSTNTERLVLPKLLELRKVLPTDQQGLVDEINAFLAHLASPPTYLYSCMTEVLTPAELRICEMIRQGLHNKEIAERIRLSVDTISTHRKNIRRKLGLNNKGISLATFLASKANSVNIDKK